MANFLPINRHCQYSVPSVEHPRRDFSVSVEAGGPTGLVHNADVVLTIFEWAQEPAMAGVCRLWRTHILGTQRGRFQVVHGLFLRALRKSVDEHSPLPLIPRLLMKNLYPDLIHTPKLIEITATYTGDTPSCILIDYLKYFHTLGLSGTAIQNYCFNRLGLDCKSIFAKGYERCLIDHFVSRLALAGETFESYISELEVDQIRMSELRAFTKEVTHQHLTNLTPSQFSEIYASFLCIADRAKKEQAFPVFIAEILKDGPFPANLPLNILQTLELYTDIPFRYIEEAKRHIFAETTPEIQAMLDRDARLHQKIVSHDTNGIADVIEIIIACLIAAKEGAWDQYIALTNRLPANGPPATFLETWFHLVRQRAANPELLSFSTLTSLLIHGYVEQAEARIRANPLEQILLFEERQNPEDTSEIATNFRLLIALNPIAQGYFHEGDRENGLRCLHEMETLYNENVPDWMKELMQLALGIKSVEQLNSENFELKGYEALLGQMYNTRFLYRV